MSKIIIHNIETGEILEREMNAEELVQLQKDQKDAIELASKQKLAAEARAALLDKLGISQEEAKLLLS